MIVEPIVFRDDVTIKIGGGGIAFQLDTMHREQCVMQKVTGTISQGAHPGSYNGQDAYNDMLVVDDGICDAENRRVQEDGSGIQFEGTRPQGFDRPDFEGGVQLG